MHYVYLLRSHANTKKTYVGMTEDVDTRVRDHNQSGLPHTAKWRPWELVAYVAVQDRKRAHALEKYLKIGSGQAWAHKHLW
jgi:putative endonuclease